MHPLFVLDIRSKRSELWLLAEFSQEPEPMPGSETLNDYVLCLYPAKYQRTKRIVYRLYP